MASKFPDPAAGDPSLQHYRCYFMDGAGHVTGVETRECADDAEATHWAENISGTHPQCQAIEVWCRARPVFERSFANGEGQEVGRPASALARGADKA